MSGAATASAGGYLPSLTGLRGIAALLVLGYHAWLFANAPHFTLQIAGATLDFGALFKCGYFGVDLFFVLSGFLLSTPFHRAFATHTPLPSLRRYWLHRCRRVLPAYWVQLVILAIAAVAIGTAIPLRDLAAHALLVQNLAPWSTTKINAVYWSMPVEWDFYVVLPLLAWLLARCRWWVALASVLVWVLSFRLLCLGSLYDPALNWLSFPDVHQLPARLDQFFFGVLAAWAVVQRPQLLRHARIWLVAGLAGVAAMMLIAAPRGDFLVQLDAPYMFFHHSLVAAAFAAIVLGAAGASRIGTRLFANAPLRWMGLISYSMYLWHYPLLSALRGLGWFDGGHVPIGVAVLCAMPLIVFVAWLSYRFVERPFLRETAVAQDKLDGEAPPELLVRSEK